MDKIQLILVNGDKPQIPILSGAVEWELQQTGAPGKLTFSVIKDETLNFEEGNEVQFRVDGKEVFRGFVFTKSRGKEREIKVTAYDQLRYLKNKDTFRLESMTASELLKRLAEDFRLETGQITDTVYKLPPKLIKDKTLFDVLREALETTLEATGKLYILYDAFGRLTLRGMEEMQLDYLLDSQSAQDFSYESSIDKNTFNRIKLLYENDKTKKREIYIEQDSEKINRWGVLQYFETVSSGVGLPARAAGLLQLYNQKTRTLTVKGALGDLRVRAGSIIGAALDLGDIILQNQMAAEKVKHKFSGEGHFMDLTLIGGEFNG